MTELKKYFPLVAFSILLFLGLSNLGKVLGFLSNIISVFMPLILGIAIAFVLNLLLKIIENKVLTKMKPLKNNKLIQKNKRLISILVTYLFTISVITLIILFIIPQVVASAKTLVEKLPEYGENIMVLGTKAYNYFGLSEDTLKQLFENFKDMFVSLSEFTANTLLKVLSVTLNITSGALSLFLGLVFSIYILAQKEKLIEIVSKINRAINSKKVATYLSDLGVESTMIFSKFVGGQIIEAMILGSLCFIGLLIFDIPYAPLVSVLIAITSLIPVVGAFIGTVPSVLIIAMESPTKALFFIIFILILQQLEGNIIYPRVVGGAIGIGGFWVFLAITVGGGLFGIVGMLLGVPAMAILYSVVRKAVNNKLNIADKPTNINAKHGAAHKAK